MEKFEGLITAELVNGATVTSLSPHQFKFSDGTILAPQNSDVVAMFTLRRELANVGSIKGMTLNSVSFVLSDEQLTNLGQLSALADIVVCPFPFLTALREMGVRDKFPNVVAFNATAETQRGPATEKVVDLNNWSY